MARYNTQEDIYDWMRDIERRLRILEMSRRTAEEETETPPDP